MFPPAALVPLVLPKFLIEHVTSQFRLLILVATCWMEAARFPTCSQHIGMYSSSVSHHSRPHHRCLSQLSSQESEIPAFNPLAAQRCVLHRQGLSSSVRWWQC